MLIYQILVLISEDFSIPDIFSKSLPPNPDQVKKIGKSEGH